LKDNLGKIQSLKAKYLNKGIKKLFVNRNICKTKKLIHP